jgi:hypothetical protein
MKTGNKTIQDGVRNKWRDIDANEVKQAVNSKADEDAVTAGLAGKQNVAAIASTGVSVQFDQPRTYGETTPETGNITLNATGAQRGQVALIRHNNGTAPTFGSQFKRIGGSYVPSTLNYIFCTYVSPTEILYTISQELL